MEILRGPKWSYTSLGDKRMVKARISLAICLANREGTVVPDQYGNMCKIKQAVFVWWVHETSASITNIRILQLKTLVRI